MVPSAINVSMLALPARACCTAPFRTGHPDTNCTGIVTAKANHLAHGYAAKNVVNPNDASANGTASHTRRDQVRSCRLLSSAGDTPHELAGPGAQPPQAAAWSTSSPSGERPSNLRIPPVIVCTTPVLRTPTECGTRAGTDSSGMCLASTIADKTASVLRLSGEKKITTDSVRG
jgi:hypothetical protein